MGTRREGCERQGSVKEGSTFRKCRKKLSFRAKYRVPSPFVEGETFETDLWPECDHFWRIYISDILRHLEGVTSVGRSNYQGKMAMGLVIVDRNTG